MTASAGESAAGVGVAVITHRARERLARCLAPYLNCPLRPRVLVVNSSSRDGTIELARQMGAETLVIPREEFNHGLTRERARKHLATDIVCMTTPDAWAVDELALVHLVQPILDGAASASYGRQIPRPGAGFLERFLRRFNYPCEGGVRGLEDLERCGARTFFCSDSFAAYHSASLDVVGGFPEALTHEDQFAVAKLLRAGRRIAYVPDAVVQHSHPASLWGDFRRSFDTGYARRRQRELLRSPRGDEGLGMRYFGALMRAMLAEAPYLIPLGVLHTGTRWLGYRIGRTCPQPAATVLGKAISAQEYYWTSAARRARDKASRLP